MNFHLTDESLAIEKFGIGQPVLRAEDPVLLKGQGTYTDDVSIAGQAFMAMVRSPHAHGALLSIDATTARTMPGVIAIYTAADLIAAGYGGLPSKVPFKSRDGSPMIKPLRLALATDKVRFVGDPVACVIAESAAQAQDAAEAVLLDIEPLPAVIEARDAVLPDAPQLYEQAPHNIALNYHWGDSEKVAEAFANAAHIARLRLIDSRVVINAMEPRAAVAEYDATSQKFTLHVPTQGVVGQRATLADIFHLDSAHFRVIAKNVGGSFGMKGSIFPEYVCALHAARELGRAVKWTDKRSDSFLSDHHGRDQDYDGELALDAEGKFLAIRMTGYANLGAYLTPVAPLFSTFNIVKHVNSCYQVPLIEVATQCTFTNTVPITAYRGAGRPEGNYYMERLIETAAHEMGIDPIELRRRNHIHADQMPYAAACGSVYDSGNFPAILERTIELSDWAGFETRRGESKARGKIRGLGLGQFVETTAPLVNELGAIHFEKDGTVTILTGTHDHGQGHVTTFAQIISEKLGIPFERIRLMQSDSDQLVTGGGTGGSKSLLASGTAFVEASRQVAEKGQLAASFILEAAANDIEFQSGQFRIAGTDRGISLLDLAARVAAGPVPDGCPTTLNVDHVHKSAPATFPNGCHVAEVEIDPETGVTEVLRYTMVGDFGTIVNPIIVKGQLHGGVVQGIGQCLMEHTVYDADGQLASGSFMDYAMPRAADVPQFIYESMPFPATTNPLGVKGCGEAGCAGAMSAVMNAIVDALSVYGVHHIDMPATQQKVWQAIQGANG